MNRLLVLFCVLGLYDNVYAGFKAATQWTIIDNSSSNRNKIILFYVDEGTFNTCAVDQKFYNDNDVLIFCTELSIYIIFFYDF